MGDRFQIRATIAPMSAPETDDRAAVLALADTMFGAIEDGDIDALRSVYADDIVVWANFDGVGQPLEKALRTVGWLISKLADRRYDITRRELIPGGFVQQHILRGTRSHDGVRVALPACIVCAVKDGKITRLDEYFDSARVAEFRKTA